jgi:UDP:flavonoid glycosyltransferase YjiC (YdhE family)
MKKKILFISGSVGLGHVTRDIGIANELRRSVRDLDILWLAAHPASEALAGKSETLLPESARWACYSRAAEKATSSYRLNILSYATRLYRGWKRNVRIYREVIGKYSFDLAVGDETYEILFSMKKHSDMQTTPFVMIYDFIGLEPMSHNPLEHLGLYFLNCRWANDYRLLPGSRAAILFAGVPEDIPERRFGPGLEDRRTHAMEHYKFTGYIIPFSPQEFIDGQKIKKELGYCAKRLIVCSVGGTGVGKRILELCLEAYPSISAHLPDLRMILVGGPRLRTDGLRVSEGIELFGYVPDLYRYFAACDLAVVQGGSTSTFELTALKKPFIYFPLERHCEQALYVRERQSRYGAGHAMELSQTSPDALAGAVLSLIDKKPHYPAVPVHGAKRAAEEIALLLKA